MRDAEKTGIYRGASAWRGTEKDAPIHRMMDDSDRRSTDMCPLQTQKSREFPG
ncbi:hypothetical protein [Pseudomonas kuykendallii]|uniref:hypothetical protein n=1 Tax=Pseudomonas kuykendallii TaxID=1007099 RepID=UPI0023574F65|nr:hypothetical protein [Pseudomonas kuykendallii]